MIIRNNTIFFKSDDECYFKEVTGIKPNTVRFFHEIREIQEMIIFHAEIMEEVKYIQIQNVRSPEMHFKRQLRDITQFPDKWVWIFSWFHQEKEIQDGFNAPIKFSPRQKK